jgi:hypothetical protein
MAARVALATTALAVALAGTAAAATIAGSGRAELLRGTATPDRVQGRAGDDRIAVEGGGRDIVSCGPGRDVVTADGADRLARDCELVSRRISRDPYRDPLGQHETEVEPDSFAFGSTVVAAFQVGRIVDGGALNIGYAVSRDGGRTWRSGLLPGLTTASRPNGRYARASDPAVAYDAVHGVWLIASLALTPGELGAVVVSRSRDGVSWEAPATVTSAPSTGALLLDKEWIVCDNGAGSPFRGNCYTSYSDFRSRRLSTQTSRDGGLTWTAPVGSPDNAGRAAVLGPYAPAPQPVVRPNGDVVVPTYDEGRIAAVRSIDGGSTFSAAFAVAPARFHRPEAFRGPPLPSAEIDAEGNAYVAWSDCSFRAGCAHNDLVVSRSADGVTWSRPTRVGTVKRNVDRLLPGLAVDPTARGRLALTYYALGPRGRIDAEIVFSRDGGASWSAPRRLNAETMSLAWLARTEGGRMLGDYISTSFAGGRVVPVFALAARPAARFALREATYAASLEAPR